jgi:hypothetical protein
MQENSDSDDENDDDIPLANLFNIRNRLDQIGFTTVDLVNVDSEVVSTKYKSDDDIIGDLLNKESDTDILEIDDEPMEENVPTKFEGLQGLETVRCVLENHENADENYNDQETCDKDDKLQAIHLIFQLCTQHIQKKIDFDFIEETSDISLFLLACEDLFYFS